LQRVRTVTAPAGRLVLADAIDWELTLRHPRAPVARLDGVGRPWWWRPNPAALRRMVEVAGFRVLAGPQRHLMPPGPGRPRQRDVRLLARALRTAAGRQELVEQLVGDPHAWLLATPDMRLDG